MGSGTKLRQRADCIRAFALSQQGLTNRQIAALIPCSPEQVPAKVRRGRLASIRDDRVDTQLASRQWRPISTANVSQLFASSTWVLICTDEGRVTEGTPHYFEDGYIWMTARGCNCRGESSKRDQMLRETVTHWMPLPEPWK